MNVVLKACCLPLCLTFFTFLVVHSACAQANKFEEGYIITLKGDSLNGLIAIQDETANSRICSFKEANGGEIKTYSPVDIAAYGIGEKKNSSIIFMITVRIC